MPRDWQCSRASAQARANLDWCCPRTDSIPLGTASDASCMASARTFTAYRPVREECREVRTRTKAEGQVSSMTHVAPPHHRHGHLAPLLPGTLPRPRQVLCGTHQPTLQCAAQGRAGALLAQYGSGGPLIRKRRGWAAAAEPPGLCHRPQPIAEPPSEGQEEQTRPPVPLAQFPFRKTRLTMTHLPGRCSLLFQSYQAGKETQEP